MELVFVLLPLALILAGVGVAAFVWAAKRGQFDDLETPAVRILFEDEELGTNAQGDESDEETRRAADETAPETRTEGWNADE